MTVILATQFSMAQVIAASTETIVNQGVYYFNRGYIQKAIPIFQKAVRRSPENIDALSWLAKAYKQQGGKENLNQAIRYYKEILALDPNHIEALSTLGEVLSWNPNTREEALGYYRRAVQLEPNNVLLAKHLAEVLSWESQVQESLMYADPVAKQYRDDPKWMGMYASLLARGGRASEAVSVYEEILHVDPATDPTVQEAYAIALHKAGRLAEAKGVYDRLKATVLQEPVTANLERRLSLAQTAYDLGFYDDALQFDTAIPQQIQEERPEIRVRIARTLAQSNRMPEAIEIFQELYLRNKMSSTNKLEYADYLSDAKLPADALPRPDLIENLYKEVLAVEPKNLHAMVRLARGYSSQPEDFLQAVPMYIQALSVDQTGRSKTELMDFLKAATNFPNAPVEEALQKLVASYPQDPEIWGTYAEILSWEDDRRPEAMEIYLKLATQLDPSHQSIWIDALEKVLTWHKPNLSYMPLYNRLRSLLPNSKALGLGMARAYANNFPESFENAVSSYEQLLQSYPDDDTIKSEWASLITSDLENRRDALDTLAQMVEKHPKDATLRVAYGRVLSYERQYSQSLKMYRMVLKQNPENRDALLGKGHALLWSDRKHAAKHVLNKARKLYPRDVEILMALAHAEKGLGRYGEAMKLIREIRMILAEESMQSVRTPLHNNMLCGTSASSLTTLLAYQRKASPEVAVSKVEVPLDQLETDLDILDKTLESLTAVQKQSQKNLDRLEQSVESYESVNSLAVYGDRRYQAAPFSSDDLPEEAYPSAWMPSLLMSGTSGEMIPFYGQQERLGEDNTLLSGRNRMLYEQTQRMGESIDHVLRPELRAGYAFSTQKGERTTNRFRHWGIPNQLSFSLTPHVRLRGGITPKRYYIPGSSIGPNSTWGTQYAWGATAKWWDRLTLDGDMAVTHFSQSNDNNVTYRAQAKFDVTDRIKWTVGSHRSPINNSLLAYAGFRPERGPFANQLVGQARENALYTELNIVPFSNWDLNAGYEWARITGDRIARNNKNQIFASLGYTHRYLEDHSVRLGYQLFWMNFSRYATTGFFDTVNGFNQPVVSLSPVTLARNGTRFGGYFSPEWFLLNSVRLDFRGSFKDRLIEYMIGGSLGIQDFDNGRVADPSPTSLASAFDALLMLNVTDWLSLYGNVDFLDSGGNFNRWRFGSGLILRPNIPGLSPLLGGK